MTLNGIMALILGYFTEFGSDVVVKSSRSLSHLLMSFLSATHLATAVSASDSVVLHLYAPHDYRFIIIINNYYYIFIP